MWQPSITSKIFSISSAFFVSAQAITCPRTYSTHRNDTVPVLYALAYPRRDYQRRPPLATLARRAFVAFPVAVKIFFRLFEGWCFLRLLSMRLSKATYAKGSGLPARLTSPPVEICLGTNSDMPITCAEARSQVIKKSPIVLSPQVRT